MPTTQPESMHAFHGCVRGACNVEAPCFTPHPWSPTHKTCMFSSALMRLEHIEDEITRTHTGEPSYREAVEILMMVSLLNRERGR